MPAGRGARPAQRNWDQTRQSIIIIIIFIIIMRL
jgi:hypothetical protein